MQCPRCDEKMERLSQGETIAHCCFYCDGVWLNQEATDAVEIDLGHRKLIEHILTRESGIPINPGRRKCPECLNTKLNIVGDEKSGLDQCPSCHGVFLDKTEFTDVSSHAGKMGAHIFTKINERPSNEHPVTSFFYLIIVGIHFMAVLWLISIVADYEIFDEYYCYHGGLGEGFVFLWLLAPFTVLPIFILQAGLGYYLAKKKAYPSKVFRYWPVLLMPFPALMVLGMLPCFW